MKNTVKKILALVFVVAMVCSLAVPAFAAENDEYVDATVWVDGVEYTVAPTTTGTRTTGLKLEDATVQSVIKAAKKDGVAANVSFRNGKIFAVNSVSQDAVAGDLETVSWVVALNGKIVSEDLSTVAVAEGDVLVIYKHDSFFDTKLVQLDDSNIEAGILSFYYYDAEGNKQPFVGATVRMNVQNLLDGVVNEPEAEGTYPANGMPKSMSFNSNYLTDEKGQIWIAPQHLEKYDNNLIVRSVALTLDPIEDIDDTDYTEDEFEYFNENLGNNIEVDHLVNSQIVVREMYSVAGATGDMTVVYVMVAAVAVITLGAVVIMKKKAVKAN